MSEVESYYEVVIPFLTEDAALRCRQELKEIGVLIHIYVREVAE